MRTSDGVNGNSSGALAALRRMLRSGDHRSDGRLPGERDLARRIGADRRAVRRALDVLEAEGLIWRSRAGHGIFVSLPDARRAALSEAGQLLEARLRLEPTLAALAALRATRADLRRMRLFAARAQAAGDSDAAELWGGAFHRCIAETAGNAPLLDAFAILEETRVRGVWRRVSELRDPSRPDEALRSRDEHMAIVEAIASGDPDAAETAMRAHLLSLSVALDAAMVRAAEDAAPPAREAA